MKKEVHLSEFGTLDYPIRLLRRASLEMVKSFPINHDYKDKRSVSDYTKDSNEMKNLIKSIEYAIEILERENKRFNLDEEININLYENFNQKSKNKRNYVK